MPTRGGFPPEFVDVVIIASVGHVLGRLGYEDVTRWIPHRCRYCGIFGDVGQTPARWREAESRPVPVQTGLHARHLATRKHDHHGVVHVVHVIHEQITVWPVVTTDVREGRRAIIRAGLARSIGNEIAAVATRRVVVTPQVVQVEPVANLVGRGTPQIEGCQRGSRRPKSRVRNDDTVSSPRAARKLRVPEDPTQHAHPKIQVSVPRPRICAASGGCLDAVIGTEASLHGWGASNSVARGTLRVSIRQPKLDSYIIDQ